MATKTGDPEGIRIVDLELPDGRIPYREWYANLRDRKARAIIQSRIYRLQGGNFGDAKSVGEEIFEMRIFYGPGYRVYFAKMGNAIVVLIGGGDKDSQSKDIAEAQSLWKQNKESAYDAITRPSRNDRQ